MLYIQDVVNWFEDYLRRAKRTIGFYDVALIKIGAFLVGISLGSLFSKFIRKFAWIFALVGIIAVLPVVFKLLEDYRKRI